MMIEIYNERYPDRAKTDWVHGDNKQLFEELYSGEDIGDEKSLLDAMFGNSGKLARVDFIEVLHERQPKFLEAHTLR